MTRTIQKTKKYGAKVHSTVQVPFTYGSLLTDDRSSYLAVYQVVIYVFTL